MNKWPDPAPGGDSPEAFERDLRAEEALMAATEPPDNPALAGDWTLKRDLARLGSAPLPDAVRARVFRRIRNRRRTTWLAAAAALCALAVALPVMMRAPAPPAGAGQAAELELAVNTIGTTARRAMALAGYKVTAAVELPDLGLARLPYAGAVRAVIAPAEQTNRDPEPVEENHR